LPITEAHEHRVVQLTQDLVDDWPEILRSLGETDAECARGVLSPSSSKSGSRTDPYDGRTSPKPRSLKAAASSSFQRWEAFASR
jgi:hypothetical protein